MKNRDEGLMSKLNYLYDEFHDQDQKGWDKLKNAISTALYCRTIIPIETRAEIRELFLTLWDKAKASSVSSQECAHAWNDLQLELQTKGMII